MSTRPTSRLDRLTEVAEIALRIEQETGLPARVLIAQWAIESKWGECPVGRANFFGIKRAKRHALWSTVVTHEVMSTAEIDRWISAHPSQACKTLERLADERYRVKVSDQFADYDSLEASCRDYAWLITQGKPYQRAWKAFELSKDWVALLLGIVRAGYATGVGYADLAIQIASQSNVRDAIVRAGSSAKEPKP